MRVVLSLLFTVFFLASAKPLADAGPSNDICKLPSVPGPCLAYFSRWYYDVNAQACESFVYGGCKGNENNFETKEECERQCPGSDDSVLSGSSDEFPIKTSGHEDGSRPCLLEKESKEKYGPMPGAFIPQCDDDGYYRPKQCWGSTGSCWCVDKFGKKLQKKTANPGEELECGVAVSPTHAPCFTALAKSLEPSFLVHGLPMPLHKGHSPSCDENGFFKLKQCYKMNCWCTDKWGNKIKHSFGSYDEVFCE